VRAEFVGWPAEVGGCLERGRVLMPCGAAKICPALFGPRDFG